MRTTCEWLQHAAHIDVGAGSSLAHAGMDIPCQLASSHALQAKKPGGPGNLRCWLVCLRTCTPSDRRACCLQTCLLMQTLTSIVLLLR